MTAANAVRGDYVRNLTTRVVGQVTGATQTGRLLVDTTNGAVEKWERTSAELISELDGRMHMLAREIVQPPDNPHGYSIEEGQQRDEAARELAYLVLYGLPNN